MAFTSLREIFNLIVLIVAIAYILSGYIRNPKKGLFRKRKLFDWDDFKFASIIAVPAILLHELAHKFVAIAFGVGATFELFPLGLVIGVILKIIHSPFLLLAPGYVVITGDLSQAHLGIVAFAVWALNLLHDQAGFYQGFVCSN